MKKYCFYFVVSMALIVLSACAQKQPVPLPPQSHRPPESVPEIGGPVPHQRAVPERRRELTPRHITESVPGQSTVPDDSSVAGKREDQNPLLSAVRPVQRPRPEALTRMIENARNQLRRKQPQLAFSTLEQALYIDGQDPLVWHLMARAQLDQGNIDQAVSLAKKSDSLAAAYPEVKEKNAVLLRQAGQR